MIYTHALTPGPAGVQSPDVPLMPLQLDDVGRVDEPVTDRVGERGLADEVVPRGDGHLAGDQRGGPLAPVLEDLEQVMAGR
jgi:hypothetical protein